MPAGVEFNGNTISGSLGGERLQCAPSNASDGRFFDLNGVPTLYFFTCNENRVQRPDGSATESMNCPLDHGQTAPSKAVQYSTAPGYNQWFSDFWLNGVPGFAGPFFTYDVHAVLTPSGVVNLSATYAAP